MKVVKEALRAKGIADSTLVALLGNASNPVPFLQRDFQTAIGTFIGDAKSLVTVADVSPEVEGDDTPDTDGLYQLDVWAKTRDQADLIHERLVALFDKQPLTITGRRLIKRGVRHQSSIPSFEEVDQIHHIAMTLRISSIADP